MEFLEFLGVAATFVLSGVGVYAGIRLVHVWTRRLMDDRSEPVSAELEELRARVHELESVRLAELEERVDFAERLLAQAQEPARLQDGGER